MLTTASALTLTLDDSTGTALGSVDFSYSAADKSFDFLAAGETLTITYDVTVTDEHNAASTRPVTITVTGTNDAPVAVADSDIGHIVEAGKGVNDNVVPGLSTRTGDVLANDTTVDLTDTTRSLGRLRRRSSGVLSSGVGTTINGTYGWLVLNANGDLDLHARQREDQPTRWRRMRTPATSSSYTEFRSSWRHVDDHADDRHHWCQ